MAKKTKPEEIIRRKMREAGFRERDPVGAALVFSSPDNLSGRPASPRFVQFVHDRARELKQAVPGTKTAVTADGQWVNLHVTLPTAIEPAAPKKKTPAAQLDREIAEVLAKPASQPVGYGLSAIDEDEWSWSVERLRPGQTTWGSGSDILADGVAYTKGEAVANIKKALADAGVELKDAVRLPF